MADDVENPKDAAGRILPRRPRRKRKHRAGSGLFATLFLATIVMCGAAFVLSGRAVPLPAAAEAKLADTINEHLSDGRVSIGAAAVAMREGGVPQARLRDVGIFALDGRRLASLNELLLDISLGALLQGRVVADRVSLDGAQIIVQRSADGRFTLGPEEGQGERSPATIAKALATLHEALAQEPLSTLGDIRAQGVVISLEDARTGRIWQATNARISMRERVEGLTVSLSTDVFSGGDDLAELQVSFAYNDTTAETSIGVRMIDIPAADIALQSPALGWLSVLDAPISGAVRLAIDAAGVLTSLDGTLDIEEGALRPEAGVAPVNFTAARAYFSFDPDRNRIDFTEVGVLAQDFRLRASGHTYITGSDTGGGNAFVGQFNVTEAAFEASDAFATALNIDRMHADIRLGLEPFKVELAEVTVEEGDVMARASGEIGIEDGAWRIDIDATSDVIDADRVMAFWPLGLAPKTRTWLDTNLISGRLTDVAFGVRYLVGERPDLSLTFDYREAVVRYLKQLPVVQDGQGRAVLIGDSFTIEVDSGWIKAPGGEIVDGGGTVVSVPDFHAESTEAEVALVAAGALKPILEIIDLPPLNLMSRAGRSVDIADASAEVFADITVPLRRKLLRQDVDFDVRAVARDVTSDALVPGRALSAAELTFLATPEGLAVQTEGQLDGMPLDANWRLPFGNDEDTASITTGKVSLTTEVLSGFGIELPRGMMRGQGRADYRLSDVVDGPTSLSLVSDLSGVSLAIPGLGWSKGRATTGKLDLEVALGPVPDVRRLSFSAPGLTLRGDVEMGAQGKFAGLLLDELRVGQWLRTSAAVRPAPDGRGSDISLRGGRLDLRALPQRSASNGAEHETKPIDVRLDTVVVTDALSLSQFRGEIAPASGGVSGWFDARLAGRTALRGTLAPDRGRTAIRVQSEDAGGLLRDAGITPNGRGGSADLVLTPIPGAPEGHFNGRFLIERIRLTDAPVMAGLLDAISVIGILDEIGGSGIHFDRIDGTFRLTPDRITLTRLAGVGPSLGISAEGTYDHAVKKIDMQGVISPIYLLNGVGSLLSRRGEGLFGFNYRLTGKATEPSVSVNPLSILAPGLLRDILRSRKPAE